MEQPPTVFESIREMGEIIDRTQRQVDHLRAQLDMIAATLGFSVKPSPRDAVSRETLPPLHVSSDGYMAALEPALPR